MHRAWPINSCGVDDIAGQRRHGLYELAPPPVEALPRSAGDVMTHGDLTPGNVFVSDGRLAAVIDVGGLGPADPALDLVGAWHLLESCPRQALREDLGCDDLEWERGKAWAFEQSMGAAWYYAESNPTMSMMGRLTLQRIVADTSFD
jgi:aminoglycoside phosphotransferase (APT) family kinase protein